MSCSPDVRCSRIYNMRSMFDTHKRRHRAQLLLADRSSATRLPQQCTAPQSNDKCHFKLCEALSRAHTREQSPLPNEQLNSKLYDRAPNFLIKPFKLPDTLSSSVSSATWRSSPSTLVSVLSEHFSVAMGACAQTRFVRELVCLLACLHSISIQQIQYKYTYYI